MNRRALLTSVGAGALALIAGCSARSDPQRALLLAVNNYTESRHEGYVRIEKHGDELVRQYVEVPAAEPDGWATVETKVAVGRMPGDTPLDVTVSFGDGVAAIGRHTLECEEEYAGDAIYVQIEKAEPITVRLNLACYDSFPSSEAVQGGLNGA